MPGVLSAHPAGALRPARVAVSCAFAVQGLVFAALLTHLPQMSERYRLSQSAVTAAVFVVVLLAGAGSALSELGTARSSSRTALRVALAGVVLSAALIGLAPGRAAFLIAFGLYGLALGAVDATSNMQAVALQQAYGRSILSSFHAAWSAGAIAGALFVSASEYAGLPLRVSILLAAAAALLAVGLSAPHQLAPAGQQALDGAAATEGGPARQLPAAARRTLVLLGLAMCCFWAIDSSISNWSSLYLADALRASGAVAALGYALYQATGFGSRLLADLVVRRIGAPRTVRAGAAIGMLGAVLVVIADRPVVAVIAFGLCGVGLPLIAPLCFAAAGRVASASGGDPRAVERVVARLNIFNYVGALSGAVLVGALGSATGLRVAFAVPVALAGALLLLGGAFAGTDNR